MPGVQLVQDLRKILDPMFTWLNLARWATVGLSALLLLAAALQIGNTIRMAAFSRRREIGIMRLVGALELVHHAAVPAGVADRCGRRRRARLR